MNYLIALTDHPTAISVLTPFGYASAPTTQAKTKTVMVTDLAQRPTDAVSASLAPDFASATFTVPDGEETTPGALNGANAMPVSIVTGYEDATGPDGKPTRQPVLHPAYWVGLTTTGPDENLVEFCVANSIPYAEIDPSKSGATLWSFVTRSSFPQANIDGIRLVSPIWAGTSYPFPGDAQ